MSLFTKNFARKSQKCFSYLKKDIALILQSIFTPKLGIIYSPSGGSGFGEEKKNQIFVLIKSIYILQYLMRNKKRINLLRHFHSLANS